MRQFQAAAVLLLAASLCLKVPLAAAESQNAKSDAASEAEAASTVNRTACREKGFTGKLPHC